MNNKQKINIIIKNYEMYAAKEINQDTEECKNFKIYIQIMGKEDTIEYLNESNINRISCNLIKKYSELIRAQW